jgi:tRNA-dihydrouridine synthase A
MLDWTDRHCRFFLRLISRHAVLYSEMVTTGALLHGNNPQRFLGFDAAEHPLALQLGGSDPAELAHCAVQAAEWGYDEVNLNVGCPSDRVQSGRFGACLMAEPALVADCVAAMVSASPLPVTVKHRIGIDEQDSWQQLSTFVATVAAAGCETFIVHARKAWLQGLSPKQNREIPPLRYDLVHRLKTAFPSLRIVINGGFKDLTDSRAQLGLVDGVMLGREAYHNPYILAEVDRLFYGDDHAVPSRAQVMAEFLPYAEAQLHADVALTALSRHILGLYHGQPGARAYRRHLSEHAHRAGAGIEVLQQALACIDGAGTALERLD